MIHSEKSQKRERTSKQQDENCQAHFLSEFNRTYNLQINNVKVAINMFNQMNKRENRLFNWFHLDELIGRQPQIYQKKSFSYKYVTEVLYKRFFIKTSDELRAVVKQYAKGELEVIKNKYQNVSKEDLNELVTKVQNKIERALGEVRQENCQ
ncbi:Hypothetical_protein [Hexamita inflata]|uniref:Hypothetical_protein n=1 Tax=Hexamita inflata TaxID=28002 RepID=A0ABP1JAB9_9EUKA